jgi:hypothetical protein
VGVVYFLSKVEVPSVLKISYFELNRGTYKGEVMYGRRGKAPRFLTFGTSTLWPFWFLGKSLSTTHGFS